MQSSCNMALQYYTITYLLSRDASWHVIRWYCMLSHGCGIEWYHFMKYQILRDITHGGAVVGLKGGGEVEDMRFTLRTRKSQAKNVKTDTFPFKILNTLNPITSLLTSQTRRHYQWGANPAIYEPNRKWRPQISKQNIYAPETPKPKASGSASHHCSGTNDARSTTSPTLASVTQVSDAAYSPPPDAPIRPHPSGSAPQYPNINNNAQTKEVRWQTSNSATLDKGSSQEMKKIQMSKDTLRVDSM